MSKTLSELHKKRIGDAHRGKPKYYLRTPISDCQRGLCQCRCKCGCGAITSIAKRTRKHLGHRKSFHIDYLLGHANIGKKIIRSEQWKKNISLSRVKNGTARGEKNPRWLGGLTKLQIVIRNHTIYKEWRSAIYERDGYKCTDCGIKGNGTNLNADHIVPLSVILRDNNITKIEEAMDCRELWDISNGRTLCVDCHKKTDSYGWRVMNNYLRKELV